MSNPPELNSRQLEAVRSTDGPGIISAGPGTGKTRTFAHRVAHLLREKGVPARDILAVTFTRSAAGEMRRRLERLLSGTPAAEGLAELWVETFHAAALRILRQEGYPFGPGVAFSVVPEEEKPVLLEGLMPRKEMGAFLEGVRRDKLRLRAPADGPGAEYQRRLSTAKLLDYEDLFIFACRLFDEKPEVLERYRGRFRHILVDEFQDTSLAQYALLRRLASGNVCVIGDPDQALYGFASGSFSPFERFKEDFPGHRVLPLSENYRSQAVILEAAKQVIRRNRAQLPRDLRARMERGLPVGISEHRSDRQEAEMTARRIEGLLGGSSHFTIDSRWAEKESESYAYGLDDIAVLYRFHAQARRFEEALGRVGLPYRTFGKKPKGDGGKDSAEEDLEDFREGKGPRGEGISLMTLHRAKGLEFPVVFLTGCEDGVLPFRRDEGGQAELEEERRLFYVGMTRAKSRLFISYAKRRLLFGSPREAGPSPFVKDIEEELRVLEASRAPVKKKAARESQPSLFDL
ncbi:MAG: UvrD-helicase domain-containing protein [Elusimicrobiota bacterium]